MNGILERFASSYAAAQESLTGKGDDQSSIHYPAVLLFIGDKTADAIGPIMKIHRQKWDNSAGVTYFHVGTASGSDRGPPLQTRPTALWRPRPPRKVMRMDGLKPKGTGSAKCAPKTAVPC